MNRSRRLSPRVYGDRSSPTYSFVLPTQSQQAFYPQHEYISQRVYRPQVYNSHPQVYSPHPQVYSPHPQVYSPHQQVYSPHPQGSIYYDTNGNSGGMPLNYSVYPTSPYPTSPVSKQAISGELSPTPPIYGPGPPIITGEKVRGPLGANLFVFHLPNEVTNWDLFLLFRKYGTILSVHIMVNKSNGLSRGFGFVSFEDIEGANEAIRNLNGFRLGSKRLKVQHKRGYHAHDNDDSSSYYNSTLSRSSANSSVYHHEDEEEDVSMLDRRFSTRFSISEYSPNNSKMSHSII